MARKNTVKVVGYNVGGDFEFEVEGSVEDALNRASDDEVFIYDDVLPVFEVRQIGTAKKSGPVFTPFATGAK
jgi:hypothetical protein